MVDVVVIGAGHNGLVAATLLARRGLSVVVLDHLTTPGGMAGYHILGGVEVPIGAYVLGLMPLRIMNELGLELSMVKPNPVAVYELDDELVRWWLNLEDRFREFEEWGLEDEVRAMWGRIMGFHRAMERYLYTTRPPTIDELLNDPVLGDFLRRTSREFLSDYLPEEFWDMFIFRSYLDEPAFMVGYFNPPNDWAYPARGNEVGMQVFAKELYRVAIRAGARVLLGVGVSKLRIEGGRVRGVVTDDGGFIESRIVLSTASPLNTLLDMVGEEYLSDEVIRRLKDILHVTSGVIRLNMVFNGEVPLRERLRPYRGSIMQLRIGEAVARDNYIMITGPVVLDELSNYLDVDQSSVKAMEVLTTSDYERIFRVRGGNMNHVPMLRDYMFHCRPICGWGYTTPIRGLYLGSSGTWPGGQVTGVPGYNAAHKILEDLSRGYV